MISALAFRAYTVLDTLSSFAPASAELGIRIIKTPSTANVLEDKFHGTTLFPNAPFTLDEISEWSKRGSEVFLNETGIVGVAIAGKVPEDTLTESRALGFIVKQRFGGTYIGTEEPATIKLAVRLPIATMLPWYNGEAYSAKNHISAPLRLNEQSLTISGLGRTGGSSATTTDQSLANVSISSEEAQNLLGFDVPLIFPGLRALEEQMIEHGFSMSLGQDSEGTPYSFNIPGGNLSREDLENGVSELYYTSSLITVPFKDVYTSLDELVSNSTAKPVTTSDPSATITTIGDNTGTLVRAAETTHGLILTNRAVNIGDSSTNGTGSSTCLARANQWVSFIGLNGLLPARLSTPGMTIIQKLLSSQEIAFSNHRTRVCW